MCIGGGPQAVYLTGAALEQFKTPSDVRDAALQILDELCAVVSLLWPPFQSPRVDVVYRVHGDGRRTEHRILDARTGHFRIKGRLPSLVAPSEAQQNQSTQAQDLLAASRAGPHLSTALLLWADPLKTWPRLYRMVEELEQHLGGPVSKFAFCSGNERERFTRSANTAAVAGKDSRHADGMFAALAMLNASKALRVQFAVSLHNTVVTLVLFCHFAQH
jgi:hypothetical protein